MEIYCTRPGCPRPLNHFVDLDDKATLKTAQQKFCTACGMPLILAGRYIPSRLLGQGGFGAAFLARDRFTPAMRLCVVKQFQPSGDLNPQQLNIAQDLFEREAETLETLGSTHPQIPDLFAFFPLVTPSRQAGKEDQFFYLVQEFIDGQDLEAELKAKGKFSEPEVLLVLQEILNVLKFVHENGSIHRDIKPSNIMRDRKGRLFLLDFGAVKQKVNQAAGAGGGSNRSTGIFTPGYAPPEQMAGAEVYPSSDLYALAATCIHLLTGSHPQDLYDGYNNAWNWRTQAQVSDHLGDVLDRMLLSVPNQRFQSAQEVLEALAPAPAVIVSTPPVTMPPITLPITPPPVISNPQPITTKPAVSLLEILGSGAFTGVEGGLLFIALNSFLGSSGISIGLLGMIVGGLIFAQYRRVIEGKDLLILAGITGVVVIFFLRGGFTIEIAIAIAVLAGIGGVAVTAIFRLVYLLLSRLF
ncbi:MAG: serine/threonine-protein kinase [Coleofasciculaceae cyanobacterium]